MMTESAVDLASTIGTDTAWWLHRMLAIADESQSLGKSATGQLHALLIQLESAVGVLCEVDVDPESIAAAKAIAKNVNLRMARMIEEAEAAVQRRKQ